MRLLMPVVSFACLLLTPIQSLTRKRGEEKPELDQKAKPTTPTNTSVSVDSIMPDETKLKVTFSNISESRSDKPLGQFYSSNPTQDSVVSASATPDSVASKSSINSRLTDFDKLSMSVEQSIEKVKSPLHEQQGYFPNILSPSTYVHMQPNPEKSHHVTRSSDKKERSKSKAKKRPPADTQYFPSPGPGPPDINPFEVEPQDQGHVKYVYPSNQDPRYYQFPTQNGGVYAGNYGEAYGGGYEGGANAFGMREKPKMASTKNRQNSIRLRYKETPEEESLLRIPDFDDESKENLGSTSSEHKYPQEDIEEPEDEGEAEQEGEALEEDEGENVGFPGGMREYPQKIKTTKEVYRTPVIKEVVKFPATKEQGNRKKPPTYVENTVRHHEVSIKNTYPATGLETLKPSDIPSMEITKPIRQGPLLRAPSSGVPTSARLTPYYTVFPLRPSVLNIRPLSYVKPKKEVTIVVRNRFEPIVLGRPPRLGAVEKHHHRHRHISPVAPLCAPCLTKQPQKHGLPSIYAHPYHRLNAAKALRAAPHHKPYKPQKSQKQVGCISPYHNGHYRPNPLYNYNYNYPLMKVPKYISTYPVYFPRLNSNQLVTPYKTVQNPPETYAKMHYYMKYPQLGAQVLGAKSPTDYQVQEESEENESTGTTPSSQEEYGGPGEEDDIRNEIDSDYEHAKYHDDQHFKPEDESRVRETYTDYGPDEGESMIRTSKFARKPRSPYIYSHQIHYF